MRVLLTGATGLVGREVGKHLVRAGHQVVTLVRNPESARQICPFPATHVKWDGKSIEHATELRDLDAVIHLAGESIAQGRWTPEKKARIRSSRVDSTRILLENLKGLRSKAQVFISASAVGYYGNRGDEALNEESAPGTGFLAEVCKEWESSVFETAPELVLRRVALRLGVVLSTQGGVLPEVLPIFQSGVAGALGSGDQWMSWIHIQDLARLFVWTLTQSSSSGPLNAVSPEPIRNHQFTGHLAKILRRPAFLPAPGLALQLVLGEKSSITTDSQRVSASKLVNQGFSFLFPDIKAALADLLEDFYGSQSVLYTEQYVPLKKEMIFSFFCDETNLERITPPFLNFHVEKKSTAMIEQGTFIDYRLRLHGIPLKWRSVISLWDPPNKFVDEQITGPYSKWYHEHIFESLGEGTLLIDRVTYAAPMGWLGQNMAGWYIRRDVQQIFDYRRKVIDELFAKSGS